MDQYFASLARACTDMGGLTNFHTDNMPSDFAVPALYFPPPETDPSGSAFNSYRTEYTIYAKVFAATRQDAMDIAESIVQGIMQKKCRLPVYSVDGKETGAILRVQPPGARVIDEGVAQITLIYSIHRGFPKESLPMMKEIGINKYYD